MTCSHPVDEYEIHRNDILHRNFTKNRNPFIDFPEWVDYVWGTSTLDEDGRTIIERDETPTGYADPSKDVVYGYSEDPVDPPTPAEEPEEQADVWTKTVSIVDGDEITFVAEDAAKMINEPAGNLISDVAVTVDDHCLDSLTGSSFMVEKATNGFLLKKGENSYLTYLNSGTNLKLVTQSEALAWGVDYDSPYGVRIYPATRSDAATRAILYRSSSGRFGQYSPNNLASTPSDYSMPSVYVKGVCNAASGYGDRFDSEWTAGCNNSGTYDGDKMNWEAATSAYNTLSTRTQQFLAQASKDNTYVGDALAKYDYIVGKYGVDVFPDFLGRNPVSISGALKVSQAHVSGSYIVIFAILGAGAALATLLLVLSKRRRHEA